MCYSFVKGNLIQCQPCVIIRLTGMLSLIHVELLRRETKSIYLYRDEDAKPTTVSHWYLPYRELLQQNVCAQIFGIFKENWTLYTLIKPQSEAKKPYFYYRGFYVPQLSTETRTVSSSCCLEWNLLALVLLQSPSSCLGTARLRVWGGWWPRGDRSGFSIQLLPGKGIWHSVGWKLDCTHSGNESLDDKQPVKAAPGHSRHLKKPSRYGTEKCLINCVSVPHMRKYATIKSLTKPSLSFQHLNGVRTLRVWKPRFCSCPCLREIPSNSLLL